MLSLRDQSHETNSHSQQYQGGPDKYDLLTLNALDHRALETVNLKVFSLWRKKHVVDYFAVVSRNKLYRK